MATVQHQVKRAAGLVIEWNLLLGNTCHPESFFFHQLHARKHMHRHGQRPVSSHLDQLHKTLGQETRHGDATSACPVRMVKALHDAFVHQADVAESFRAEVLGFWSPELMLFGSREQVFERLGILAIVERFGTRQSLLCCGRW